MKEDKGYFLRENAGDDFKMSAKKRQPKGSREWMGDEIDDEKIAQGRDEAFRDADIGEYGIEGDLNDVDGKGEVRDGDATRIELGAALFTVRLQRNIYSFFIHT